MDDIDDATSVGGPFGSADGRRSSFAGVDAEFVDIPLRFGGIGTDASDARVRVLSGALGSGKSFLLRRLRDYQESEPGTLAVNIQSAQSLTTEDLAEFQKRTGDHSGNTEQWKLLWRRAIMRAVVSMLLHNLNLRNRVPAEVLEALQKHPLSGQTRAPRTIPDCVHEIISTGGGGQFYITRFLGNPDWPDLEYLVASALREAPPIFIYLDGIDDNFKWAPGLWSSCQRGLFYCVMDLLREDEFRNRLHVVSALRDTILASVRASEHALRYLDAVHVRELRWDRRSMRLLLDGKLAKLPREMFLTDARTVESWLGVANVHNTTRGLDEPIETYLLRHTRLVPRDLVILGNALSEAQGQRGGRLSEAEIKEVVSATAARFASAELETCTNQLLSDLLPADSLGKYDHIYLHPDGYGLSDNKDRVIAAIESVGSEVFDALGLTTLDESARESFAAVATTRPVRLADILWQHRLIGVLDGTRGTVSFFDPTGRHANLALSRGPGLKYIWHPIVLDVTAIVPSHPEPVWPQ